MMELLGRMPTTIALGGRLNKRFFDRSGHLRRIKGLSYWPLKKVLCEKYRFREQEAQAFADFLTLMLNWNPDKRLSAQQMLEHPWIKMASNYDIKMTDEEFQEYLLKQQSLQEAMDPPLLGEEMSKLEDTDAELNGGGLEDNAYAFLSEFE
jgi:serine/threonine protein kinase